MNYISKLYYPTKEIALPQKNDRAFPLKKWSPYFRNQSDRPYIDIDIKGIALPIRSPLHWYWHQRNRASFTADKHEWKNRIAYIVIASFTVRWGRVYKDYLWVT